MRTFPPGANLIGGRNAARPSMMSTTPERRPTAPRNRTAPTPNQLWETRHPVTPEQRSAFQASVHRQRQEVNAEEGIAQDALLQPQEERKLNRPAIRRALGEHDYLLFLMRRLPLPIKGQKTAIIT